MARIIISHFSPIRANGVSESAAFYDGLTKSLVENGNDVLQIITNDFIKSPLGGTNTIKKRFETKKIRKCIVDFNPDLVISFNNSTLKRMERFVDCPFVLWDADYFEYFSDKQNIRKNRDRFTFFSFSEGGRNDLREHLGLDAHRIHLVKPATGLMARDVSFRDNISFIGSFFMLGQHVVAGLEKDAERITALLKAVAVDRRLDFDAFCAREDVSLADFGIDRGTLLNTVSAERRNKVMSAVAPLGLRIFGPVDWFNIASFSLDAFFSYDPRLVYSLDHNEDVYNRSRIAINVTHWQNVSAYPWRVPDIMATNACLVSDYSRELSADFGKRVPLQTYETPAEAHDVCKRLLADETLRADVVAASQDAIRQGFTWQRRLHEISQILGITLCEPGAAPGRHEILRPAPFLKIRSRLVAEGKRALVDGIDALLDADVRVGVRMPISAKKRRRIRKLIRKEPPRPIYGDGEQLMDRSVKL